MDKKEIEKLFNYIPIAQQLRDTRGWGGEYEEPIPKESITDIRMFFNILFSSIQINAKEIAYPADIFGHPRGGITLEWDKIIKEYNRIKYDFLALTFFGNKTIYLESDLEFLRLKKIEEFELSNPLNNIIIQYISYF